MHIQKIEPMKPLIIIGAGGTGRELLDFIKGLNEQSPTYEIVGFLDDNPQKEGTQVNGVRVLGPLCLAKDFSSTFFLDALGSPTNYRSRKEALIQAGMESAPFETFIHPSSIISTNTKIGLGCVIYPYSIVGPNCELGAHVTLLAHSIVHHDTTIGDFSILASGVRIAGRVVIDKNCYVGASSSILGSVHLGEGSLIGMGSNVIESVPSGAIVAGNPARKIRQSEGSKNTPIKYSIVVMAFNEAHLLQKVVSELEMTLSTLSPLYEILIVDDGSTDETGNIADILSEKNPNTRVIHHLSNQGLGSVYRTGFTQSKGEAISFFPSDGQFPASILRKYVPLIETHDMVLGYILLQHHRRYFARLLSRAERFVYRLLFGQLPKFQGVFMVRRKILDEIPLTTKGRGWGIVMELILRAQMRGYRIINVPIEIQKRRQGYSKVTNLRTLFSNLSQLVALRYRFK